MNLSELQQEAKNREYGEIREIIHTVLVLHAGWEMDNTGWIVEMINGTVQGFQTSHGGLCPWAIEDIRDKFEETERSFRQLQIAVSLMEKS